MKALATLLLFISLMASIFSCKEGKEREVKSVDTTAYIIDEDRKNAMEILSTKSLGIAYLEENDLDNAEEQFKRLIDLSPDDASGYANLGVVYLRQGKNDDAEKYLLKAIALSPEDPDIRLNLAKVYEISNDYEAALKELKKSEEIAPDHVKTLYSIAEKYEDSSDDQSLDEWEDYMRKIVNKSPRNIVARLYLVEALVRNNKGDEALKNLEEAQQIYPNFPTDAENYYSKSIELLQNGKAEESLTPIRIFHNFLKLTPEYQKGIRELKGTQTASVGLPVISMKASATTLQDGESILDVMKFTDATDRAGLDFLGLGAVVPGSRYISNICVQDMDGDGDNDLYFSGYSSEDSSYFRFLLVSDLGRYKDITKTSGIGHEGRDYSSNFVDIDNDGFLDLYISNSISNVLYKNVIKGVFTNVTSQSELYGSGIKSLFVDIDHEGDLDLIIGGNDNTLFRNNGDGTFSRKADLSKAISKSSQTNDVAFGDFDSDGDIDLIFANEDGPCLVFSNLRQGRLVEQSEDIGLNNTRGSKGVRVFDYDNDGHLDLLIISNLNGINLYHNQGDGTFKISKHSETIGSVVEELVCFDASVFDFDNDGFSDILLVGQPSKTEKRGVILLHNDGDGFSDASYLLPENILNGRQIALADYNQDGDLDIFLVEMDGGIKLLRNDGGNANHHLKIQLVGLRTGSGKNNYYGIGATVEVRAGDLYQKKVITNPGTHFGLGQRKKADVVRILWTNGVPQNIFSPGSDQDLIETQELKGSCPFLYTWNGEEYVFVKDMMWRSALGMPLGIMGGKAAYAFANASEEYLKIPERMLQEKDGKYTIQITAELWETIYNDQIKLIAVDHHESTEIYVDEKFEAPPYPELRIYSVKDHLQPLSAIDGKGNDLLSLISKKDNKYISNFRKEKYQGITELKELILDLGDIDDTKDLHLFLNGWIFPTDASINVALSQSDELTIRHPSLEVINENGDWEEVVTNIGFPAGKNKTMIIDLSDKFLSSERKVRIWTNMEIYWDYIFFARDESIEPEMTVMYPQSADHHYRGFSKKFRKGGRYGPHWFDYGEVSAGQKWRDLTGTYTRYGDVTALLLEADDMYIIANAGDETTISFDTAGLPGLQNGWRRDFLIYSVGWVKDGDLNTALGQTVAPLPFHDMSRYPFGEDEHYPMTWKHQEYQEKYNSREVGTEILGDFLSDQVH